MAIFHGKLEKAALETLSTAPVTGVIEGRVYYDTTLDAIRVYDGSAWRTVDDLDSARTLTNKTLTGPAVTDYIQYTESSAPSTPASGKGRTFVSTDGKFKFINDDGLTKTLGDSGTGEINLIAAPSDATGWTETGTRFNGYPVTTSTAGDLPLSGVIDTAIQIVSSTTVAGDETTDYVSYAFTTPASLTGKLKVQFYMRPGSNFAASEWTVSVYQGSTRQSLSTDSSSLTYLPNAAGKFTTTFDAVASTAYTLRFTRRVAGSAVAATLNLASVIVGPGIQAQGAAVGSPQSYSFTHNGSNATNSFNGTRVGENLLLNAYITFSGNGGTVGTNFTVTAPAGMTFDTAKMSASREDVVGTWVDASVGSKAIHIWFASTTTIKFTVGGSATTLDRNSIDSSDSIAFQIFIPIAEWAGSGTVNLAQNDVEYAHNSSTANGDDTTSFAYGPNGSSLPTSVTSQSKKRVRFQTPIQATDRIEIEVQDGTTLAWEPHNCCRLGSIAYVTQTNNYGVFFSGVNSTDVDVVFSAYSRPTGATFGAAGESWSSAAGTCPRWRLRKTSGGQAVGFGTVSETSAGLMPASHANLDNASATRLGLKQYLHGTTYNGGNAPTVTLSSGGGTLSSVTRAIFIPYQMQDGTWRLRFTMTLALSSTSRTVVVFSVNGITTKNVASYYQPIMANTTTGSQGSAGYANPNASTIVVDHSSAQTAALYVLSGDIELESKPTWAY